MGSCFPIFPDLFSYLIKINNFIVLVSLGLVLVNSILVLDLIIRISGTFESVFSFTITTHIDVIE